MSQWKERENESNDNFTFKTCDVSFEQKRLANRRLIVFVDEPLLFKRCAMKRLCKCISGKKTMTCCGKVTNTGRLNLEKD